MTSWKPPAAERWIKLARSSCQWHVALTEHSSKFYKVNKVSWLVVASGRVRRLVFLRVFYDLYVSIVLFLNAHMYMMLRCWWVGCGGWGGGGC